MKHQPYLDWLFLDLDDQGASLTNEQRGSLQEHLDCCTECQQLSEAWQRVDQELRAAPQLSPAPGFTQRWILNFEAERQLRHRRQTRVIIGITSSLVLVLLTIFFLNIWSYLQSPELIIWPFIYQLLSWASFAGAIQAFLSSVLDSFGRMVPPMGWILVAGVICQLFVLWLVSFRYLIMPRRVTK